MYRFTRILVALLSLTLVAAACGAGEDKSASRSGIDLDAGQTIVDIAAGNGDFSTLVAAVTAADLGGTLSGTGPFTVFAPTNDAFDATLAELGISAEDLLADKDLLTTILTNHVVNGVVLADQVVALTGEDLLMLGGGRLPITAGPAIDGAAIVQTDLLANNGVVHVIDQVLIPETPAS